MVLLLRFKSVFLPAWKVTRIGHFYTFRFLETRVRLAGLASIRVADGTADLRLGSRLSFVQKSCI
jgi:hypothetical protein